MYVTALNTCTVEGSPPRTVFYRLLAVLLGLGAFLRPMSLYPSFDIPGPESYQHTAVVVAKQPACCAEARQMLRKSCHTCPSEEFTCCREASNRRRCSSNSLMLSGPDASRYERGRVAAAAIREGNGQVSLDGVK